MCSRSVRYAVERTRSAQTREQLRWAEHSALEKARLERGLLPKPLLSTDAVDCSTYYQPGRDHAVLGGDFFDVIEVAPGVVRAVIGDVMGHGPDEAALGVHLRVAWRTMVFGGMAEDEVLPSLHRLLTVEEAGGSTFVTACDLTLDTTADTVTIRTAGHPAPLLCQDATTRYLDVAVGPPLGIGITGPWPSTEVAVRGGSSLILYTDGLLDSYVGAHAGDGLGIEEVTQAVDALVVQAGRVSSWIPAIVREAPSRPTDDTAVVVLTTRPGRG